MIERKSTAADERNEQAALWCMRLAETPLTPEEQKQVDGWIADDPANAAALEEAVSIWQRVDATIAMPEMIRYRAEAVEALRQVNERRWMRSSAISWRALGAIAATLTLLTAGLMFLLVDRSQTFRTDVGERRVVLLEDGTRLTLDGSTRVNVRMERDRRRLELVAGRAKFDVAHDPLRPLSVLARNRLTVATGTSFSVELLRRQVRVILYQGTVEVLAEGRDGATNTGQPKRSDDVILAPGHELVASTEGSTVRVIAADVERSLTWETGLLSFDGEPLALAVERMNRGGGRKMVVSDPLIASYAISGVFSASDVDAFIEGVGTIYPVKAVSRDSVTTLSKTTIKK